MAENVSDTGAEAFFEDVSFGTMTEDEYNAFLESNPDLKGMLDEERTGLFEGTVSLAQIMGIPDEELLGVATAGADLLKDQRWEEARDVFVGLTTLEPAAPMFQMGLAQAYDGLGETEPAIEAFTKAIDLSDEGTEEDGVSRASYPVIGDALYGRGCCYIDAEKPDEALADMRRLCDEVDEIADPRVESALSLMAGLLGGEEAEAAAVDADLPDEEPDAAVLSENPDLGESLEADIVDVANGKLQVAAMAGMEDEELGRMAETGMTLLENGRFLDAEEIFTGLTTLDPTVAVFQIALGNCCERLEEDDRALETYDAAVAIVDGYEGEGVHDNAFDVFYHRGKYHLRVGNGEQALADLTKAIEIDPDVENPLTQHAAVLVSAMLGAAEEAQGG